jgi:hypothetical protein
LALYVESPLTGIDIQLAKGFFTSLGGRMQALPMVVAMTALAHPAALKRLSTKSTMGCSMASMRSSCQQQDGRIITSLGE